MTIRQQITELLEGGFEVPEGLTTMATSRLIAGKIGAKVSSVDRTLYRMGIFGPDRKAHGDRQAYTPEKLREMKADYSGWPGQPGMTARAVARKHGVTEREFQRLREEHGWTHASPPVLDEDLLGDGMTDEEITAYLLDRETRRLDESWTRERMKALEADALKWRKLERGVWEPFWDWLGQEDRAVLVPPTHVEDIEGERALVIHPTDLHIGKQAARGASDVAALVLLALADIINRAPYKVDQYILVLGNDWFHADTPRTTTAGTPQDIEGCDFVRMIELGYATAEAAVDMLERTGVPVRVVVVPSNHDMMACYHLCAALKMRFAQSPKVEIHSAASRLYLTFGDNLLGFAHGHNEHRAAKLGALMAHEVPAAWGSTKFRYFFVGHLHYTRDRLEEENGSGSVHIFQGPSLSVTDRWHQDQGYVTSGRAMAAYLLSARCGYEAKFVWSPEGRRV